MKLANRSILSLLPVCAFLLLFAPWGVQRSPESAVAAGTVSAPVRVTPLSPFIDGCEGRPLQSRAYRGAVVEPTMAIDPGDPQHLVAAWVQDKIATAAASGVLAAVSRDGGITWTPSSPR